MTIQTKYNIGDIVWTISNGRLHTIKIIEIQVAIQERWNQISYGFMGVTTYYRSESECWPTVDEFVNFSLETDAKKDS